MFIPASTYRVQLHKDFTFTDLELILDYLYDLGVTTIYAAPILKAKPGSMHGYDIVDPHRINPEIGTLAQFKKLLQSVRQKGMSWIQDIVPNHMAFHSSNARLMDALERGEHSPYRNYFDVDWNHPDIELNGKIQVPFLGKPLEECLTTHEIRVEFTAQGFGVTYFDSVYPLSVDGIKKVFAQSDVLKGITLPDPKQKSVEEWSASKNSFIDSILNNELQFQCLIEALESINLNVRKLREVLAAQSYRLSYWKETETRINYRRFFTVNELICLRMEDEQVFNEYHSFIHSLYQQGFIQGIRIDHIDGLHDPLEYLNRLRNLFGKECYIVAEKILESKEGLPHSWPIEGTSGYEFLSFVNQLVTSRKGAQQLVSFYKTLLPGRSGYAELVLRNKWLILENYMAGEWDNLMSTFKTVQLPGGFSNERMKLALGWFMVSLPVYRIYPDELPLTGEARALMNETFEKALKNGSDYQQELQFLRAAFLGDDQNTDRSTILYFLKRLMQFTGPLTAKGVEDTTFYVYNALISHDEVGDAPSSLGISITEFHRKMVNRQMNTPLSLNATATHDTKRGEDARIRLNVLCDYPDLWQKQVSEWLATHVKYKKRTSKGTLAPSINDEYYIYQSVVGGFPEDNIVTEEFVSRLIAYQTKVIREAKVETNWSEPDEEYEKACRDFIRSIMMADSFFINTVSSLLQKISVLAWRYSIAQTLIKITAPGIPDTYQGGGLWDLSFVDPDNRRPVDYVKRMTLLSRMKEKAEAGSHEIFSFLDDHRHEGVEKLFVTWKGLNFRKANPELFTNGSYLPLQVSGNEVVIVAFMRRHDTKWLMIVIPLRLRDKKDQTDVAVNDVLILPEGAPTVWLNIFTDEIVTSTDRLPLGDCFNRFAIAMLTNY